MRSRVVSFRVPDDLYEEYERKCKDEEVSQTVKLREFVASTCHEEVEKPDTGHEPQVKVLHVESEKLDKITKPNVKSSTFTDWLRILEILGAKVYPSDDWCEIKVTTAIDINDLNGCGESSLCYNINIASPKL